MHLRTESKIVIGFVLLVAAAFGGYQVYTRQSVANLHFDPVVPGTVNLVGIDPGSGYQIIVANQIAQLVEASGQFEASESSGGGAESGAIKRRIPIKEMLGALRGDSKSLGEFVAIMNDLRENEKWPTVDVVWTAEDIQKAINGDPTLQPKLVRDLNMKLDGTPLSTLRPSALMNGIIIDYPVSMKIAINGVATDVVGRVRQPFMPKLLSIVSHDIEDKQITPEMMAGYYSAEARKQMSNPAAREDIKASLIQFISPENAARLRAAPERVLQSATVVINEHQIESSSMNTYDAGDGKRLTDLTVRMTDEGRQRLWKYSIDKVPSDLLFIVDGIAIAAPRIVRPLTEQELTIRRMPDEVLARDAVDRLNQHIGKREASR
jgi:hypothetical protein